MSVETKKGLQRWRRKWQVTLCLHRAKDTPLLTLIIPLLTFLSTPEIQRQALVKKNWHKERHNLVWPTPHNLSVLVELSPMGTIAWSQAEETDELISTEENI